MGIGATLKCIFVGKKQPRVKPPHVPKLHVLRPCPSCNGQWYLRGYDTFVDTVCCKHCGSIYAIHSGVINPVAVIK